MLRNTTELLTQHRHYELQDVQNIRTILKERSPEGLSSLTIEGEILLNCSTSNSMIKTIDIPTQTPLNPMFFMLGSTTGIEQHIRKGFITALEQAQKGIEVESELFSLRKPFITRNLLLDVLETAVFKVYKFSQRAQTNLSAVYLMCDLEEYQLTKGAYPVNIEQLKNADLTSTLPNDPDSDSKIIYSNDGQRAVLYAVGKNSRDDGGYKDSDKERDDIIYWERSICE
jgi:hypothetical protein